MGHTCLLPAVVDKAASMLKTASVVIGQTRYLLFLSEQGPLLIALLYSALTAPYIYINKIISYETDKIYLSDICLQLIWKQWSNVIKFIIMYLSVHTVCHAVEMSDPVTINDNVAIWWTGRVCVPIVWVLMDWSCSSPIFFNCFGYFHRKYNYSVFHAECDSCQCAKASESALRPSRGSKHFLWISGKHYNIHSY